MQLVSKIPSRSDEVGQPTAHIAAGESRFVTRACTNPNSSCMPLDKFTAKHGAPQADQIVTKTWNGEKIQGVSGDEARGC